MTETPEQDIWYTRVQQFAQRIAAKDAEIAQLRSENERLKAELADEEQEHERTIIQRDAAEETLSNAYLSVTGCEAIWSNLFGYDDALNGICSTNAALREKVAALENRNLSGYDERKDFQK